MDINNLNWDQHKLTEKGVHSLTMPKEMREVLSRAVTGGHPMIAMHTGKSHIRVYIKDDGIVHTTSSGGGQGRGTANFEAELRRGHRSVGKDFPRRNESVKAFQKRMTKNQGGDSEQE